MGTQQATIAAKDAYIARRDHEIKFKDAKIEPITFELARLTAWKVGVRTEVMSVEQRQPFEDKLAEDEGDLQAQLDALQTEADQPDMAKDDSPKRRPRREATRAPAPRRAPTRAREHRVPDAGLRASHGTRGRRRQRTAGRRAG